MAKANPVETEVAVENHVVTATTPKRDKVDKADKAEFTGTFAVEAQYIHDLQILQGKEHSDQPSYYAKLVLSVRDPQWGKRTTVFYLHGAIFDAAYNALNGASVYDKTQASADALAQAITGIPCLICEKEVAQGKLHTEYNVYNQLVIACSPFAVKPLWHTS